MVQQFDVSCQFQLKQEIPSLVFSFFEGTGAMLTVSVHSGDKDDDKVGDLSRIIDLVTCRKKKNKNKKTDH
jgi:hypothetical protein